MTVEPTKNNESERINSASPDNAIKWKRFEELRKYDDGKLWGYLNNIYPQSEQIPPLPPHTLYHYTDVHGLRGIIESNSLSASAAYYLNDSSEVEYGCRLINEELKQWIELNKAQESVAATVLSGLQLLFMQPLSEVSRRSNIFVSCFCEEDNLLSQWRAYGQKGGYSLGFGVGGLSNGLVAPGPYNPLRLVQVIYSDGLQLERIRSVLRQSVTAVGEAVEAKHVDAGQLMNFVRDVIVAIQELLLDEVVSFKHPAFSDEREWRVVARLDLRAELPPSKPTPGKPLHQFRQSGGYVVPFIELGSKKEKLPLASVRFGPSLDFKRYEDSIRMLLAYEGFSKVELNGSELPVIL
jgi:hypothetical protein